MQTTTFFRQQVQIQVMPQYRFLPLFCVWIEQRRNNKGVYNGTLKFMVMVKGRGLRIFESGNG
jgi:hypothetical protein